VNKHLNKVQTASRLNRRTAFAIAASMMAAHAAMAQQTTQETTGPAVAADSVVTVVGTRKSVASAIDRKIRNATVSDSIIAEDINQFPDKNVGEALSRITGVQLTRDFGEGSQVAIRGVEPDLNRVEINGMSVLGTNGEAGRGAELRELASELISSIDVFKGTTADMTEGGVGGTVSIKTRKPLDFKKRTIATTVSAENSSSRGGVQPRLSLLAADKFLDNKLGVMANLVYDKVLTRNDYARNTSWRFLRDWDFSADKTVTSTDPSVAAVSSKAGCATTTGLSTAQRTACTNQWNDYSPNIPRYGIWTRDHKRSSAELTAQYEFSKNFNAYVSYQLNKQEQRLNDRNWGTDLSAVTRLANSGVTPTYNAAGIPSGGTCVPASTTSTPAGVVVEDHHVTEYVVGSCLNVAGQGGQGVFSSSARDFALDIKSEYTTTGFNYKNGALELEGLLGVSSSKYTNNTNSVVITQNAPGLKVTLDDQGLPHFTFPSAYSSENPAAYTQVQLQYRPYETTNREDQLKLDGKYRLSTPFFNKVWFGVQGRDTGAKRYNGGGYIASTGANLASAADDVTVVSSNINQTLVFDPLAPAGTNRSPDVFSFANQFNATSYINAAQMSSLITAIAGRSPGEFFKGFDGVSGLPSGWTSPSYAAAAPSFDTSHFNQQYLYNGLGSDGNSYAQIPAWKVREKTQAAYARLDFDTELLDRGISGNIGVRYTRTRDISSGSNSYRVRQASSPGSSTFNDYVISNSVATVDNTYHDYLPSANIMMWAIPDEFLVRAGFGKVMSRPRIDLLAPNAICTQFSGLAQFGGDGTDDCSAGNPNLKPFRAKNYDLSFEYYPNKDTQVSMALFKKKITSYIMASTLVRDVDLFNNGVLFDVTQPINGEGAETKGVELTARTALTFLPGWLSGFGVDTNYTRMTFKYAPGTERLNVLDSTVLPYPGLSKNSYNVSLWYDLGKWNARAAYTYRDRFFTGNNDVSGNPVFQEKTGFLDAKLQYRINDNLSLSVEGKNLTDQEQTTDAGSLSRVNELAFSGRRYFVSASYKF
jgi:iron complex outermembrane receptor protein